MSEPSLLPRSLAGIDVVGDPAIVPGDANVWADLGDGERVVWAGPLERLGEFSYPPGFSLKLSPLDLRRLQAETRRRVAA